MPGPHPEDPPAGRTPGHLRQELGDLGRRKAVDARVLGLSGGARGIVPRRSRRPQSPSDHRGGGEIRSAERIADQVVAATGVELLLEPVEGPLEARPVLGRAGCVDVPRPSHDGGKQASRHPRHRLLERTEPGRPAVGQQPGMVEQEVVEVPRNVTRAVLVEEVLELDDSGPQLGILGKERRIPSDAVEVVEDVGRIGQRGARLAVHQHGNGGTPADPPDPQNMKARHERNRTVVQTFRVQCPAGLLGKVGDAQVVERQHAKAPGDSAWRVGPPGAARVGGATSRRILHRFA